MWARLTGSDVKIEVVPLKHGCWLAVCDAAVVMIHTNTALHWHHNGCDGVSNHQPRNCLHNRLFRRRSKKIPKLRVTGLCAGNSPVIGEFPARRASNAENVSIRWRHHEKRFWEWFRLLIPLNTTCGQITKSKQALVKPDYTNFIQICLECYLLNPVIFLWSHCCTQYSTYKICSTFSGKSDVDVMLWWVDVVNSSPPGKMTPILQGIFSDAFPRMKSLEFW